MIAVLRKVYGAWVNVQLAILKRPLTGGSVTMTAYAGAPLRNLAD
jgi:hypothetical protein